MPHFWLARSNSSLLSSVTRAASIHSYYSNIVFDFVFPPERIRSGRGTEGEPNGERQSDFQRGMSTPSPPPLVRRRRRRDALQPLFCPRNDTLGTSLIFISPSRRRGSVFP